MYLFVCIYVLNFYDDVFLHCGKWQKMLMSGGKGEKKNKIDKTKQQKGKFMNYKIPQTYRSSNKMCISRP